MRPSLSVPAGPGTVPGRLRRGGQRHLPRCRRWSTGWLAGWLAHPARGRAPRRHRWWQAGRSAEHGRRAAYPAEPGQARQADRPCQRAVVAAWPAGGLHYRGLLAAAPDEAVISHTRHLDHSTMRGYRRRARITADNSAQDADTSGTSALESLGRSKRRLCRIGVRAWGSSVGAAPALYRKPNCYLVGYSARPDVTASWRVVSDRSAVEQAQRRDIGAALDMPS